MISYKVYDLSVELCVCVCVSFCLEVMLANLIVSDQQKYLMCMLCLICIEMWFRYV